MGVYQQFLDEKKAIGTKLTTPTTPFTKTKKLWGIFPIGKKEIPIKTKKSLFDRYLEETGKSKIPEQPEISPISGIELKTKTLPSFLGGGAFKGAGYLTSTQLTSYLSERNDLTTTEKNAIRGGFFEDTGKEVDHIIPLALGGTNDEFNLQALKNKKDIGQILKEMFTGKKSLPNDYKPKNRQEGKMVVEWKAINKYKKGEISLAEARAAVLNYDNRPEVFLHESIKGETLAPIMETDRLTSPEYAAQREEIYKKKPWLRPVEKKPWTSYILPTAEETAAKIRALPKQIGKTLLESYAPVVSKTLQKMKEGMPFIDAYYQIWKTASLEDKTKLDAVIKEQKLAIERGASQKEVNTIFSKYMVQELDPSLVLGFMGDLAAIPKGFKIVNPELAGKIKNAVPILKETADKMAKQGIKNTPFKNLYENFKAILDTGFIDKNLEVFLTTKKLPFPVSTKQKGLQIVSDITKDIMAKGIITPAIQNIISKNVFIIQKITASFLSKLKEVKPEVKVELPTINIERLNISQEAKQKIIKTSEEIKPQLEEVKGKVLSNDEVVEAAQKSEILRKIITRAETLKSEAMLLKTRQHLAELAKNKKLTPEFVDTLRLVSAEATKKGRELQALGIEADPILGTIKTKMVKQLLEIGIETDKIIKASEGIDFNNAKQVGEFYRKFVKPTLPEIIDEYRYINMLSSPKTQIINTFSNILQATVLRPATRLTSGLVDTFAHILKGKEQEFYIKQTGSYYKGAFNSFGDALSEAMKVMRGEQQIYRPDIKNIPTGIKIFKPFQVIPRLMEASDVFFRKIITGGEMEALMSKGIKESIAISRASKTAEELVFRKALDPLNKTGQGILLSKIDALTTAIYKLRSVPGIKWFIPFVQTPMNIFKQGIEYSPLGVSTLPGNVKKIEQFGKTLIGTLVFLGGGWLALKDKTTWAVPINPKEKEAFYAAGMQPYSIKIGDKWIPFSRIGPLAYPIAMAAAIKFYTKDNPKAVTDTELQKITKIISGIAQFFSDQSYVQGIGDFIDIARGDITAATRVSSQIPSQLIPLTSLQRWIAALIDPIYRKTEKKLSIEGIIENLKKGIPFLTKGLPSYTTPSGELSKRQYPILNLLSPISISKESPEWKDYFNTFQQVSRETKLETKSREELKQSAQTLYDKMKVLPKEEARRQFDDLIKNNPDLAKEISDLITEIKLDYKESFLKSLGVKNGQRSRYIVQELNKLKTKEEKKLYYQNLIDKKIITSKVNEQIIEILNRK